MEAQIVMDWHVAQLAKRLRAAETAIDRVEREREEVDADQEIDLSYYATVAELRHVLIAAGIGRADGAWDVEREPVQAVEALLAGRAAA